MNGVSSVFDRGLRSRRFGGGPVPWWVLGMAVKVFGRICGWGHPPVARRRAGFTLLEVMLAVIILGGALTVIYRAIIVNARMVGVSRERQEVAYVFSLGELAHPLRDIKDIEEDVPVDPDTSLKEGYVFERTVDEKEDPEEGVEDDGLYVIRTSVTWGDGLNRETVVRYIRKTE